jgi:uncharacterized membrane protein YgcG
MNQLPYTTPPFWAYDYCYFFYFLAVIQLVVGLYGITKIIGKNKNVAFILALSIAINCLTTLMLFWMCRGSLKERFEVECTCGSTEDCITAYGAGYNCVLTDPNSTRGTCIASGDGTGSGGTGDSGVGVGGLGGGGGGGGGDSGGG